MEFREPPTNFVVRLFFFSFPKNSKTVTETIGAKGQIQEWNSLRLDGSEKRGWEISYIQPIQVTKVLQPIQKSLQ